MAPYLFLSCGQDMGQSPVEWGETPYLCPSVHPPKASRPVLWAYLQGLGANQPGLRASAPANMASGLASQASWPASQVSDPASQALDPASQASGSAG